MSEPTIEFIARQQELILREIASLRDDMTVTAAILNRIDHNQSSFIEELRALRQGHERLRSRVDHLETKP